MSDFKVCPYCLKLNPTRRKLCGWCGNQLPSSPYSQFILFLAGACILATSASLWVMLR